MTDDVIGCSEGVLPAVLTPVEAARRLGVTRSRVYALVRQGELDDLGGDVLRVTAASVERRLAASPPAGEPIGPLGAWAILALASHDAAFRMHLAGRVSDRDRSRAKRRLEGRGLLQLVPRLRARAVTRRFAANGDARLALLEDPRGVLAGSSAARQLGWALPAGDWPVELYVAETDLVELVELHELELADDDGHGDLVLRAVSQPWSFPPHARVVPEVVAALDLAESPAAELAQLGHARLADLAATVEASWRRRPARPRPQRPIVPTGARPRRRRLSSEERGNALWDDRAEQDARHLVALLFMAVTPLRRAEVAQTLRLSPARLEQACRFVRTEPPYGLLLEEHGDQLCLVSAPDCAAVIQRHLKPAVPEALSQAALESLAIVVYTQPVTRAEIRAIRGVDSDSAIDTLLARGLIAEDPRFGGRGRPAFLVTTAECLRLLGVGSLADLPPLPATEPLRV